MSGQGYHLAISPERAKELLNIKNQFDVLDGVNDLLEQMTDSEPEKLHGGYKWWNLLLLCLSDGTYDPRGGVYPLNQCFFGGKLLVSEGSIVNLVIPNVVRDTAIALGTLGRDWFSTRFTALFAGDYPSGIPVEEYETYYEGLAGLQKFYTLAAEEGKAVVFYTDDCLSYFFDPDRTPPNRR